MISKKYLFIITCFFFISINSYAQIEASLRTYIGIDKIKLDEWNNFFGSTGRYNQDDINLYYGSTFLVNLTAEHTIKLSLEYLSTKASIENDATKINWEFNSIPILFGYEFHLRHFSKFITPYIGINGGFYFTNVESKLESEFINQNRSKRSETGYGYDLLLGFNITLSNKFYINTEGKYRYSNASGFSKKNNSVNIDFTGYYFSLGAGYIF